MQPSEFLDMLTQQFAEIEAQAKAGVAPIPPPDAIASFVRMQRSFWGWKQGTLASMAGVSLSTVERVARGEVASTESLDRIAVALHQPPGAFTTPRVPLGVEETIRQVAESVAPFKDKVWIPVRPVRGQRQIVELASSHCYICDPGRLSDTCADDVRGDVAALTEFLDLVSFILSTEDQEPMMTVHRSEPVKRRKLYNDVLSCVRETERRTNAVILAGRYEAETDNKLMPTARVAVIGYFPKSTDPAAIKRRTLAVPARISIEEAWNNFCANVDGWNNTARDESTQ